MTAPFSHLAFAALVSLGLAAAGCGDKKEGDSTVGAAPTAATTGGTAAPKAAVADLAAIHALLPAEFKDKLEFEVVSADDGRIQAVMPKGWKEGVIPGMVKPQDDADLGFMTKFSVGSNCDGDCAPKDWKAVSDKVDFAQYTGGSMDLVKDEPLGESGRLVIAKSGNSTYITAAWWKADASRYFSCHVSLDREAAAAADAFEKACLAMTVVKWK